MHRFLFISLALVCLLAGCSAPQTSAPATDESDNLDAYFEEKPADNEVGSAEFGLQDPMDMVYTYDGDPSQMTLEVWQIFCFAMLDLSKRNMWNGTY